MFAEDARVSTARADAPLDITLLHNYREEQQPSMRLYAERLGSALLREGAHVRRVFPPRLVPDAWRSRSWLWQKIDDYGGSHVVYPRLLRKLDTDIVHVIDHSQGYLIGGFDLRRTVVTCHDVILLALAAGRIGGTKIPRVALQIFRLSLALAKKAAAIVADSHQTKRDLADLVGIDPARVQVIFPGLNQDFSLDPERGRQARDRLGLGNGLLAFQIGRAFYKNIPGVIRIVGWLRQKGIDVRLVRTGRSLAGEDRALAERLGLHPHVVELGGISDAELPALYNAVDVLLFPSFYEGFGWPPLEAMASGTPVVSSRAGSLDEIVGDAALTADPEDIETLAWHAAAALTDARTREALVARGLAHASRFRWDRTARQMIDLYSSVAARAA
jgi:glycosyltransferase involved in cell wall biosynthesis